MSYYVTDDLFNKVEGMSKAQILALFENASYTPSFYAGALDNGVSYLYTGIKPTDALLKALLEHGLGNHTLTDIELDAINANVFSVLFIDAKTVAAKSDGTKLYLNIVGEQLSTLSSSERIINNYATEAFVIEAAKEYKNAQYLGSFNPQSAATERTITTRTLTEDKLKEAQRGELLLAVTSIGNIVVGKSFNRHISIGGYDSGSMWFLAAKFKWLLNENNKIELTVAPLSGTYFGISLDLANNNIQNISRDIDIYDCFVIG